MTRLDITRRNKKYRELLTYGFFIVIIGIFMLTIGLKILINTSLFIANLTNSKAQTETTPEDSYLLPPEITDIVDATNSATIRIAGSAEENKTILIYVNNDKQKELVSGKDGFSTELKLDEGINEIYVELDDEKSKTKKTSHTYQVDFSTKKPELSVQSPTDQEKVGSEDITVQGKTEVENSVRINDRPVVVQSDGGFSSSVRLKEGENQLVIVARNSYGTSEKIELTVFYQRDI